MSKLFVFFSMLVLALSLGNQATAQQKLVVAGYGGSFEDIMRKDIFPAFEKKHNVKIDFVAGNSTNTVARLQAQKGNQEIDVAIVDDGPMYQAIALGFCAPIQGMPADDITEDDADHAERIGDTVSDADRLRSSLSCQTFGRCGECGRAGEGTGKEPGRQSGRQIEQAGARPGHGSAQQARSRHFPARTV